MAISDINTPWEGHSGSEVESFLKEVLAEKFGHVTFEDGALKFYAKEGDTTPIQQLPLGGTVYNLSVSLENGTTPTFSALIGDEHVYISFSAATTAGALGETPSEFVENYSYVIAVDSGTGFVNKASGTFNYEQTATVDVRQFIVTGSNRIRITVTGGDSHATKSTTITGTLTNLLLTVDHAWQNVWREGVDYSIRGIRFSGNILKTLHVKVGEHELTQGFSASQNYTTTATTYEIGSELFPPLDIEEGQAVSGVHEIEIWLSGGEAETQHYKFNIMCLLDGDTTPMVCANNIASKAVNFNNDVLYSFAVVNANSVMIQSSVALAGNHQITGIAMSVEEGQTYNYAPSLEVDIVSEITIGTLSSTISPYMTGVLGDEQTITMPFDNSLAFNAEAGAVFYLNAAMRSNNEYDRDVIKNAVPNAAVSEYSATWNGFGWRSDGWTFDEYGHMALVVPARCSVSVANLKPFYSIGEYGATLEMMIRSANIADETTPILSFVSGTGANREGFILYPTKVMVLSTTSASEVRQSVGLCENIITHLCVTIQRNYSGQNGKNLCSIYVNGIPNVSFAFSGTDSFGDGYLQVGQANTDFYLYMMRIYERALEGQAVFSNFLNAIFNGSHINRGEYNRVQVRDNNDIIEGTSIDYHYAVRRGYNCMVIEPDDPNAPIPDFYHKYKDSSMPCTVCFEYWGTHPEWNVKITNVPLDGQGTTSKKYYRWNLRGKLKNCDWYYADANGNYNEEPSSDSPTKKGYMAGGASGAAGYSKIDRFTAKKNIASSQQGHKMGATALYDDLFAECGLKSQLPNSKYRVAVWQYPFLGFVKRGLDSYEFIGLYTAGPDKGCKTSFGYSSDYPSAMCIEGPNHNPRATRFLHPWKDVDYDQNEETLTFGGEEGWDCDYCQYETAYKDDLTPEENAANKAAVLGLYNSEWKPAYELVFHCSPYIASIAEMLASNTSYATMDAVNADITNFLNGTTTYVDELGNSRTRRNELMSFYDNNYDIWYYRNSTHQYEKLVRQDGDNQDNLWRITTYLSTYLNGVSNPTTAQILNARKAKFKAEVGDYFYIQQSLYHKCYCLLIGAKDNDAKNTYPFKHLGLNENGAGNRWGWKQDDLDSIFDTDNNGQATVKYSVEYGDTNNGVEVFQGSDSAFWTIIWEWYQSELATMFGTMIAKIKDIGEDKNISASGDPLHEAVYKVLAYYFFDRSALYFPIVSYQHDRIYGYIDPWYLAGQTIGGITYDSVYNGVPPLTQALGDRYQDERLWLERRIAYLFSKYNLGGFSVNPDGYGTASFTLAQGFTFSLVPAIDLYPSANTGGGGLSVAGRTNALTPVQVTLPTGGSTTNYINGVDWLYSLGDIYGMQLTSRGASHEITFSITSARLHDLKIGNAVASNVLFNATDLSVVGASLVEIDARNTLTLNTEVDLSNCPRLQRVLFGGSSARGIMLPEGSRVEYVSFPLYQPTLFLHSMNFLTNQNIELSNSTLLTVQNLYFNCCENLNGLQILASIMNQQGNALRFVTLVWDTTIQVGSSEIAALVALARGTNTTNPASGQYGRVNYEGGQATPAATLIPLVQGKISLQSITQQDYDLLRATFPLLEFVGSFQRYLHFDDARFEEFCAYFWGDIEDKRGQVIASGTLEGNGDNDVYSDYVFVPCAYIPAHVAYPNAIVNTAARSVTLQVELTVEGSTGQPWDLDATTKATSNAHIFGLNKSLCGAEDQTQHYASILSDGSTGWGAQSVLVQEGNKWNTTITTDTTLMYVRLHIRAAEGVTIHWSIKPLQSGNPCYIPIGITQAQCERVISFGISSTSTTFRYNPVIRYVDLRYFTKVTNIVTNSFYGNTALQKVVFSSSLVSIESNAFIRTTALDATFLGNTQIGGDSFYTVYETMVFRFFSTTPPTITSTSFRNSTIAGIYVRSNYVDIYRAADVWSTYKDKMYSFIDGCHYISKDGTYTYTPASCFSGCTNITWSLESNEYLTITAQVDGSITIAAQNITNSVNVEVDLEMSLDYDGYTLVDTLTIGVCQLNFIVFEDSDVKEICVTNWGGKRGAGGKYGAIGEITVEQAACVSSLSEMLTVLNYELSYYHFREFKYFTGIGLNAQAFNWAPYQPSFYARTLEFPSHVRNITNVGAGYEHTEELYLNPGIETVYSGARGIADLRIVDVPESCTFFSPYFGFGISNLTCVWRSTSVMGRDNRYPDNFNPIAIYVRSCIFEAYKVDANWSYRRTKFRPFIIGPAFIHQNGNYEYSPAEIFDATNISWSLASNNYVTLSTQADGSALLVASGITSAVDTTIELTCTFTSAKFGTIADTRTIPIHSLNIITFADNTVKGLCVGQWGGLYGGSTGISGVDEELTLEQAAAVTTPSTIIYNNRSAIAGKDFPEISLFGFTTIPNNGFRSVRLATPIILPHVTTVGDSSFREVNAPYLHFGENLTSFTGVAGINTSNLGYLRIDATTPPNQPAIGGSFPIYVPDSSVSAYQTAWSSYSSRIKGISEIPSSSD